MAFLSTYLHIISFCQPNLIYVFISLLAPVWEGFSSTTPVSEPRAPEAEPLFRAPSSLLGARSAPHSRGVWCGSVGSGAGARRESYINTHKPH
jgi:hypothetical protein